MTITTALAKRQRNLKLRARVHAHQAAHAILSKLTRAWADRYWAAWKRGDRENMIHASAMLDQLRIAHDNLATSSRDLQWDISVEAMGLHDMTVEERYSNDARAD